MVAPSNGGPPTVWGPPVGAVKKGIGPYVLALGGVPLDLHDYKKLG